MYEEDHADEFYEGDQFYDASPYFTRTRGHVHAEEEERILNQTRSDTLMRRERCLEERSDFGMNNHRGDVRNNCYETGENRQNLMQGNTKLNTLN